jgi:bifunctional non-homologous end joining protein LigD
MLAEGGHQAFDDDRWWFEPKLDGIRCLAQLSTGETILRSRTGRVVTDTYPELHMIHELIDEVNAVIDGEIVAVDADGKNSFEVLQQRMNLSNPREIERAKTRIPVSLVVFDLLWLDGRDVTGLPLEQRRELLSYIVEEDQRLRMTTHIVGDGSLLFEAAKAQQLEGIVAKRIGSPYMPGRRTDAWRKIKVRLTQDCVVLGFTPGQGGRGETFGALLVGAYVDGDLRWVGQVGSGFTDGLLSSVLEELDGLRREEPAVPELGSAKGAVFVEPTAVCEVTYLEMTKSTQKMRAPVFLRMRPDKVPEDCVLETPASG